jgi:hypothetical protein
MKIKNYTTMTLSETFCSLRTTAFVFLLGVLLLTNAKSNAQNNALHLDGVDDYISLPATINDQITTNNVTIEGWFNIESSIGDEVELVGERYDGGVGDYDVKFMIFKYDNKIQVGFINGATFGYIGSAIPTTNTWVHIAGTYDGAFLRLYYNGVEVAQTPETGALSTSGSNGFWVLGRKTDGAERFGGKMDEVRIWNTTRTPAEILANYKDQVTDNSTGLVAYYKMNQGVAGGDNTSVTSLIDSATSTNDSGNFVGFALNGSTSNFVSKSTVWNSGWSEGEPNAITDAIIDGTYTTTTNGAFSANSLTVNSAKSLTINSLTNIKVLNEVINNGTLIVENNANLIQVNDVTNTGAITVNRNSNALYRLDYTLWSSPVTGAQTLANFSPLTSLNRFYDYDTNGNQYVAVPSTSTFVAGKGNLIRMPNEDLLSGYNGGTATLTYNGVFTGIPNNGNVQVTLSGFNAKYNLVGNPYPSVIDADAFIDHNNPATIESTLYFWRKKNAAIVGTAYASYTLGGATSVEPGVPAPNGKIQVGQGFFVQAKFGTTVGNFFTNAMRDVAPTSTQFYKTRQVAQKDRLWLNLTSTTGVFSQALVAYISDATSGVDKYDGKYINDSPIALTSNINNDEYTIQGRPAFDVADIVALNFKTDKAGDYTIAIDHTDGLFASGQDIYLVDNTTGTETNLKSAAYTFTAAAGVDNSRFSLKYQKTLKVDAPAFNENSVYIYSKNGTLYVNSGKIAINNIQVYDVQGRLIAERKNVKANTTTLENLKANNQVLLVKISGANNEEVTKKILN